MTDNCSFFPEGAWSQCCYIHDLAYANIDIAKLIADVDLFRCVSASGHPFIATIILIGVVTLGLPFWIRARLKSGEHGRRS